MEHWDLYDENRQPTGERIAKGEPVPTGRYFITVVVFMQNSKGELLLQKRSKAKGGKWATTGGHPKSGESSLQGIITEIKEELGIDINPQDLHLFHTIKTNNDFVDLYCTIGEFKPRNLQKEEVETTQWFSKQEIKKLIADNKFHKSHVKFFHHLCRCNIW